MSQDQEVEIITEEAPAECLVTLPSNRPMDLFRDTVAIKNLIGIVESKVSDFEGDSSTPAGRKAIASMSYKVTRTKTYLDGIGKNLVAELKDLPRKIDASRKLWRDSLDAIAERVRQPLTEWEQAEEARKNRIMGRIQEIRNSVVLASGFTAKKISGVMNQLREIDTTTDEWEEFGVDASAAREETLAALDELWRRKMDEESQAAELKKLREEKAELEARERDERIRREAEDKARRESESKAKAEQEASVRREMEAKLATERAERERQEAERRAQEAEARAEKAKEEAEAEALRRQQETERKAAEEKARREADIEHRRVFNREAVEDLMLILGGDQDLATAILKAIVIGKVRHVSIAY